MLNFFILVGWWLQFGYVEKLARKRSPFRLLRWFRCFIFVRYGALLVHNCMLFQSTQSGTCKSVSSLIVCKCSNPNLGGLHLSPTKPGSWPWSSVSLVPKYGLVQALAKHSVYLLQLIPPEYFSNVVCGSRAARAIFLPLKVQFESRPKTVHFPTW